MNAKIEVKDESKDLPKIFAAEQKRLVNERADYNITNKKGLSIIKITAQDPTALRAVLNSICKILIVYNKTSEIVNNS